jgi:hypothetical protein
LNQEILTYWRIWSVGVKESSILDLCINSTQQVQPRQHTITYIPRIRKPWSNNLIKNPQNMEIESWQSEWPIFYFPISFYFRQEHYYRKSHDITSTWRLFCTYVYNIQKCISIWIIIILCILTAAMFWFRFCRTKRIRLWRQMYGFRWWVMHFNGITELIILPSCSKMTFEHTWMLIC